MNAIATSAADDNGVCGSDSDSNSDDLPEYYHPLSTVDNGVGSVDGDEEGDFSDPDPIHPFHHLPNGLSSLDLSDGDGDDEDHEEEEATDSERAIEQAFREDEMRRTAPLTTEDAGRVMEAMRRISFGGVAPEWAVVVPEDQWIDRIRRLRPQSNSPHSS